MVLSLPPSAQIFKTGTSFAPQQFAANIEKLLNFIWIPFSLLPNFWRWLKLSAFSFSSPTTVVELSGLGLVLVLVFHLHYVCILPLYLYFMLYLYLYCICVMLSDLNLGQYCLPLFVAEQTALFKIFSFSSLINKLLLNNH